MPAPVAEALKGQGFLDRTPLWVYILAEAGASGAGNPDGNHLGKVGSTILAETFWNLITHSVDSVLANPPAPGEIPAEEQTIAGIIKLGVPVPIP